jgi:hypothetical protein
MCWASHVARMGEKTTAYRLLVGKPEGKGPLGRPQCKCVDYIRMDLVMIGLSGVDFAPNFGDKRTDCCITRTHHFPQGISGKRKSLNRPTRLTWCHANFLFPRLRIMPFSHNWCDPGRIAGSAEHPYRTRLPGCI